MKETFRIGVTASRDWSDATVVRQALTDVQGHIPSTSMLLVHGMCPPRRQGSRAAVRWERALTYPIERQLCLAGGDWLSDVVARLLGWQVEQHPASWSLGRGAGFARNEHMVKLGASAWLGFIRPCSDPRCREPSIHGSHGAMHCMGLARRAGIPATEYRADW